MISWRCAEVMPSGCTMRPPFGPLNAVIERSISAASRPSTAVASTPNVGATASISRKKLAQLAFCRFRMNATPVYARRHRFEFLEPLPAHLRFEIRKSGKIAARSRQTRNKADADGIGDPDEHNRYGLGLLPKGGQDRRAIGEDRFWRQANDFGRVGPDAVGIAGGPTVFDSDIAALHPSRFAKRFPERGDARCHAR
jgi:hypothetical protein